MVGKLVSKDWFVVLLLELAFATLVKMDYEEFADFQSSHDLETLHSAAIVVYMQLFLILICTCCDC